MEWTEVKDALPEKPGRYLVYELKGTHCHNLLASNYAYPCCEPNIAYFNQYCGGWQWCSGSEQKCTPTHWMPLSEPPKEE